MGRRRRRVSRHHDRGRGRNGWSRPAGWNGCNQVRGKQGGPGRILGSWLSRGCCCRSRVPACGGRSGIRRWILLHRNLRSLRLVAAIRLTSRTRRLTAAIVRLLRGRINPRHNSNLRRIGRCIRNALRHRQLIFVARPGKVLMRRRRLRRGHRLRIQPGMRSQLCPRPQCQQTRMPRRLRSHRDGDSGQRHSRDNHSLADPQARPSLARFAPGTLISAGRLRALARLALIRLRLRCPLRFNCIGTLDL